MQGLETPAPAAPAAGTAWPMDPPRAAAVPDGAGATAPGAWSATTAGGEFRLGQEALATLQALLRNRVRIAAVTAAAVVIGTVLTLVMPSEYQSKVQMLPAGGDDTMPMGLGQAAGLASSFGINLGQPSMSMAYPDILKSRQIRERILDRQFDTAAGVKAPLLELLHASGRSADVRRANGLDYLDKKIRVGLDKETGVLELIATMRDAGLAQAVAAAYVTELIQIEAELNDQTARTNKQFIEKRLAETEAQLHVTENAFRDFETDNLRVGNDPELQLTAVRLQRDVRIQEEIYLTLVRQYELAKIEENRDGSGVQVIDPASRPLARSSPILLKNLVLAAFLGCVAGCVLVVGLDWLGTARLQAGSFRSRTRLGMRVRA